MIPLTCDACDKSLKLRDELAGKRIKCPGCGASLSVPTGDDEEDDRVTAAPKSRKSEEREEDDEDDGPSKPHPVFLIVGMSLALFGLVAMCASIYFNHENGKAITGLEQDVAFAKRELANNRELSKLDREKHEADSTRDTAKIQSLRTSRYIAFAVVFGVIFLLGVGLRGYYFIAMKKWKATHPDEDKKKKKKKKRRDE